MNFAHGTVRWMLVMATALSALAACGSPDRGFPMADDAAGDRDEASADAHGPMADVATDLGVDARSVNDAGSDATSDAPVATEAGAVGCCYYQCFSFGPEPKGMLPIAPPSTDRICEASSPCMGSAMEATYVANCVCGDTTCEPGWYAGN